MRIYAAVAECYGAADQRTLDAKADWEAAVRMHREAEGADALAEQQLLESKKRMISNTRDSLDKIRYEFITDPEKFAISSATANAIAFNADIQQLLSSTINTFPLDKDTFLRDL